jgi:hypothetical protein
MQRALETTYSSTPSAARHQMIKKDELQVSAALTSLKPSLVLATKEPFWM